MNVIVIGIALLASNSVHGMGFWKKEPPVENILKQIPPELVGEIYSHVIDDFRKKHGYIPFERRDESEIGFPEEFGGIIRSSGFFNSSDYVFHVPRVSLFNNEFILNEQVFANVVDVSSNSGLVAQINIPQSEAIHQTHKYCSVVITSSDDEDCFYTINNAEKKLKKRSFKKGVFSKTACGPQNTILSFSKKGVHVLDMESEKEFKIGTVKGISPSAVIGEYIPRTKRLVNLVKAGKVSFFYDLLTHKVLTLLHETPQLSQNLNQATDTIPFLYRKLEYHFDPTRYFSGSDCKKKIVRLIADAKELVKEERLEFQREGQLRHLLAAKKQIAAERIIRTLKKFKTTPRSEILWFTNRILLKDPIQLGQLKQKKEYTNPFELLWQALPNDSQIKLSTIKGTVRPRPQLYKEMKPCCKNSIEIPTSEEWPIE